MQSPNGLQFEGFVALIHVNLDPSPQLVFESGKLTLPGGAVLNGEFSLTFAETDVVQYYHVGDQTNLTWSPEPYIFHGSISPSNGISQNVWAIEDTLSGRPILSFEPEEGRQITPLWYILYVTVAFMIILGNYSLFGYF